MNGITIETVLKTMTTMIAFHDAMPRRPLRNFKDQAVVETMKSQPGELSTKIVTRIILFRECHFAQSNRAIFRKARPVLMISGHSS
jgi:hypothetical protein